MVSCSDKTCDRSCERNYERTCDRNETSCESIFWQIHFYFKLLELVLCITGTVIFCSFVEWHYSPDRSTVIAVAAALPNCIICVTVQLLMLFFQVQHCVAEICLNGTTAVLNLAMAVVFFYHISGYQSSYYLIMCLLCVALGAVLLLDFMRYFKCGN